MNTSDQIRALGRQGLAVAEIARRIGVRYQHAYNVLKASGLLPAARSNVAPRTAGAAEASEAAVTVPSRSKPALTVERLTESGFQHSATWVISEDRLALDRPMPSQRGVYAFTKDRAALYVGLATMGLAKRLYFYGKPGATQRTSQRLSGLIKAELLTLQFIDIYTVCPPNLAWNGLPVCGDAGLEAGLIEAFWLPWNIRGVRI